MTDRQTDPTNPASTPTSGTAPTRDTFTVTRYAATGAVLTAPAVYHATSAAEALTMAERDDAGKRDVHRYDVARDEEISPAQLADTPATCEQIAEAARDLGCRAAYEHPGYVRIVALNGRIGHLGTANGPWQLDVYRNAETEGFLQAEAHVDIPASHHQTAEGIARFAVGTLAGIYEYTTYASERENRAATRAERAARNRR